ncbi:hypothetical protein A6C57_22665 [Fibrella sp. ES10-3-2-2]|nr:hypothetical protein A6C57_22665 [Fibrella sp. ES10-3-2-2]
MKQQEMILNIPYDSSPKIWEKVASIYDQMEGWLGFGEGDDLGELDIPYWFNYDESQKHVFASVEPPGLQVAGIMSDEDWKAWSATFKRLASKALGYEVVDVYES